MDDKKIISGIKNKKEPYLSEFINKYGGVLKASIVKTIGNRDDLVIEILNDTLLAIWDNIDYFDEIGLLLKTGVLVLLNIRQLMLSERKIATKVLILIKLKIIFTLKKTFQLMKVEKY